MANGSRNPHKVWDQPAIVSSEEWDGILKVFSNKRYRGYKERLEKLRAQGNTPTGQKGFGTVSHINVKLTGVNSPFRVALIGTGRGRKGKKVAVVRVADGIKRGEVVRQDPLAMPASSPTVTIERIRLATDPEHDVFWVVVANGSRVWHEVLGSQPDLDMGLRFFKIGVEMMGGRFGLPNIPSTPSKSLVEAPNE